jgi:hypothetical protein
MSGVVEAYANKLADRADASADSGRGGDYRQCGGVDSAKLVERLRKQSGAGDIGDIAG